MGKMGQDHLFKEGIVMRLFLISATALCLSLSACGQPAQDAPADDTAPATEASAPADAAAEPATIAAATPEAKGKKVFAQCMACHSVKAEDGNKVGPNLAGIVGKPSASVAGFNYSPAMLGKPVTWDEATLMTYLEKPMAFMPGTKMAFAGIADEGKRKALIAFLKNPAAAE